MTSFSFSGAKDPPATRRASLAGQVRRQVRETAAVFPPFKAGSVLSAVVSMIMIARFRAAAAECRREPTTTFHSRLGHKEGQRGMSGLNPTTAGSFPRNALRWESRAGPCGPGTSPRKKSRSLASNDRNPLGTTVIAAARLRSLAATRARYRLGSSSAQIVGKLRSRLVTLAHPLHHAAPDDARVRAESRRQSPTGLQARDDKLRPATPAELRRKKANARKRTIHRHPDGPQIGAGIQAVGLAASLLRCHIGNGAGDLGRPS